MPGRSGTAASCTTRYSPAATFLSPEELLLELPMESEALLVALEALSETADEAELSAWACKGRARVSSRGMRSGFMGSPGRSVARDCRAAGRAFNAQAADSAHNPWLWARPTFSLVAAGWAFNNGPPQ